jgi:hypothetical protein
MSFLFKGVNAHNISCNIYRKKKLIIILVGVFSSLALLAVPLTSIPA